MDNYWPSFWEKITDLSGNIGIIVENLVPSRLQGDLVTGRYFFLPLHKRKENYSIFLNSFDFVRKLFILNVIFY